MTETELLFAGRFTGANLDWNFGGVALVFILMVQVSFTRKIHLTQILDQELEIVK